MAFGDVLGGRVQKHVCLKHSAILGSEHKDVQRYHCIPSCVLTTSQRRIVCKVQNALSSSERQLRSLDEYFDKLRNDAKQFSILNERAELLGKNKELAAVTTLEGYHDRIMAKSKEYRLSDSDGQFLKQSSYTSAKISHGGNRAKKLLNYMEVKAKDDESTGLKNSNEDASSLYLTGIVGSINVGVFLLEIASPVRNGKLEVLSIPSLYGAKINDLIIIGEWWRLVTPMFLHSGVLHIGLGMWLLLSFGPAVCRTYGSFTFILIYLLGGISGNFISFLHTSDPTVGGTGPAFALIGAWLIYKAQNRDMIEKEVSGSMFWKAMLATALSFVLSNLGPIDNWSHFGAAVVGVVYGYLACPTLEMDNASSESSQKEGITLVKQSTDPCKSLIYFSLFIMLLCSLLLIIEPPLASITGDEF